MDPDVRCGDSMDIRPYVKLKIIPGGSMHECEYVDGVVFRKNVSHKKMMSRNDRDRSSVKENPKILILGGGIEFQRTDTRLSSMDTLIEQEDSYISILVEKIMYVDRTYFLISGFRGFGVSCFGVSCFGVSGFQREYIIHVLI